MEVILLCIIIYNIYDMNVDQVGIEDCLHIEFEYNKAKYHMKDAVVGKVFFLLVRIKIKMMEICIIKRETLGSGIFIESLSNID